MVISILFEIKGIDEYIDPNQTFIDFKKQLTKANGDALDGKLY